MLITIRRLDEFITSSVAEQTDARPQSEILFAHIADVHLGAFRDAALREFNVRTFEQAIDICIRQKVEFIIISGDLFHANIPDLAVVERAARRLRTAADTGIRIYVIYGSHDFSAVERSIIDVLHSAGLFCKVELFDEHNDRLLLRPVIDRTGVKLYGLSGRARGLERKNYERLDRASLETERGPKIFLFHSCIEEYQPGFMKETVPLALFPKGFSYYAGGHIHTRAEYRPNGYGLIVYPGPLFGSNYTDLESGSRFAWGFYLVTLDLRSGTAKPRFQPLGLYPIVLHEQVADGESVDVVRARLAEKLRTLEVSGKIVMLKLHGELAAGRLTDLRLAELQRELLRQGAVAVCPNTHGLRTRAIEKVRSETRGPIDDIEHRFIEEQLARLEFREQSLMGETGYNTARQLLAVLKEEQLENERKDAYLTRVLTAAEKVLGVNEQNQRSVAKCI